MLIIKKLRLSQNMTQSELAKRSRLSQAYINELENGKKINPSISSLLKLSGALGVSPQDIFDVNNLKNI